MDEMIFVGTLATVEKRVKYVQDDLTGVKHKHRLIPRAPRAGDTPTVQVIVGLKTAVSQVVCRISEPAMAVVPLHCSETSWDTVGWRYVEVWQGQLPPQADGVVVRYQIEATVAFSNELILADEGTTFSYLVGDPATPAWSKEAIIYQIFPDRFYPGNGRSWQKAATLNDIYGGTLRGIIDQLDYITALGFNCIWLNPFFPDHTHHGYHATDYFTVNPRVGTMDDIRELVQKAHDRGIRLLLDFVANHWGSHHKTFQDALTNQASPYYDWYEWIDWPRDYKTFFAVMDLPKVNVDHPDARAYMLKSARFWLEEIGFDGLRLDYVLGPSHDFWTALRAEVKSISSDIWLYGEAVETPLTQLSYEGRFDGCLDFLLSHALRNTFATGTMDLAAFDAFLTKHERFFPDTFSRPSFLDNHDMNRILFKAGNDPRKVKLAALCQFTLSGPPIVYNGAEVNVPQQYERSDPRGVGMAEARQPMVWGEAQDKEMLAYFTWLIHFRREHSVLINGRRQTVHLDSAAQTYAYTRSNDDETLLIALNLSEREQSITVGDISITLPPCSGDIIQNQAQRVGRTSQFHHDS